MEKVKLTKSAVDRLPYAEPGKRYETWDNELKGYGVRVSATDKTFIIFKRVAGKMVRVTLGKYGVLTADQSRKAAINVLADLNKGRNINQEKAKARLRGITLEKAADLYLEDRDLKESTRDFYRTMVDVHLKTWKSKPLKEITEDMVRALHKKLTKGSGKVTANNVMKTLRAVYNYAATETRGDLPPNPTLILRSKWNRVEPRKTRIQAHELEVWYQAVTALRNPVIRDFLLFTLHNGLRKNEALELRWSNVDFRGRTFTVVDPKNRHDHTLPFTTYTESLLSDRYALRENDFVFPGVGKSGHLAEPRKQIKAVEWETCKILNRIPDDEELRAKIASQPEAVTQGIRFMPHDLRRTFANTAQRLATYSELKRLLNHAPEKTDVTQDYLNITVEDLREPLQRVADALMVATRAWCPYQPAQPQPEPDKVIHLEERRKRKAA